MQSGPGSRLRPLSTPRPCHRRHLRDPFSGLSHLFGALCSVLGTIYMFGNIPEERSFDYALGYGAFSFGMLFMFSSSAVYHLAEVSDERLLLLKRIDHIAIFFMIAGSYTPYCLIALHNEVGPSLLVIIWTLAAFGFVLKVFWLHAPRYLQVIVYLGMGWCVTLIYGDVLQALSPPAMFWLSNGGIAYSSGALIYALKFPNFHAHFGFHELWHVFVLVGACCHFLSIAIYL